MADDGSSDEHENERIEIPVSTETRRNKAAQQNLIACKKRIKDIKHLQDKQFEHEIKNLEAMQQCAYDQVRFHRIFAITTLWPPLHNRKEIESTMKRFYRRTERHMRRINSIFENMKF